MTDCIIVGAGPAGSTAAYHLAKLGRSVILLDKASLPRYKACGGGVSPGIAQWLDIDFSPVIAQRADTIRCTWKLDDPLQVTLQGLEPVWIVHRDRFDHFLVQQAQAQGANLRDATEVTGIEFKTSQWYVQTTQEPIVGRYLIAADGAYGRLSSWLGFKPRTRCQAGTLEIPASSTTAHSQVLQFDFGTVKNGYIWNFPKDDGHTISIATVRGNDAFDIQQSLIEYAHAVGLDGDRGHYHKHSLCLWNGNHPLHTQQAVLVGEAAGIVDPFTAEGIRPAIASGATAAQAIDRALSGDLNALEHYTSTIHHEWGTDFVWAQRLAALFYRIPGVSYRVGVKVPAASQKMAEILCGKLRYSSVVAIAIQRLTSGMIPNLSR